MLADSPQEKQRWVGALTALHKILVKNELPNLATYQCKELYDSSLLLLKNPLSACIYDKERILMGTEDGLHVVETARDGKPPVSSIITGS